MKANIFVINILSIYYSLSISSPSGTYILKRSSDLNINQTNHSDTSHILGNITNIGYYYVHTQLIIGRCFYW